MKTASFIVYQRLHVCRPASRLRVYRMNHYFSLLIRLDYNDLGYITDCNHKIL